MIGYLEVTVRGSTLGSVLLLVSGVGYRVALRKETAAHFLPDAPVSLFTYLAVREDALDLYGFETEEELRFFEQLLTVSGIGPKSALAVLDMAPVETLRSAIASGNATYLTSVSGIGKKTAEKIVLELKDKVGAGNALAQGAMRGDEDALAALQALGYSASEARDALRAVPQTIEKSNDRLREALKSLGRK